jgi:hypothetical protein
MNLIHFKDKKILIVNFIIIITLALFSVLNFRMENFIGSAFGVIVAFTIMVFDNEIKNYKDEEPDKKKMLKNIFTHCGIYIIIYGLILLVFKIEIMVIIKIMIIQIFLLIYCIARHLVSKVSYKKKAVFYILFFSIIIGVGRYGLIREIDLIDNLLYSIAPATVASALLSGFIFIKSDGK